jgi:hypothetical protein
MLPAGARPPTFPNDDEESDDPIEVARATIRARRRAAALGAA